MQELETRISTGNVYGLQRTQSEIQDSIEIVPEITHDSFVFDASPFLISELEDVVSDESAAEFYASNTCVATSTMSCFESDGRFLGASIVSIPTPDAVSEQTAQEIYADCREDFGPRLIETVENHPSTEYESDSVTADDIGLDEMSVFILNEESDTVQASDIPIHMIGFISETTVNILYLVAESINGRGDEYESLTRHLDTMTVFESPKQTRNTESTVYAPCERVLSSPKIQAYIESEYVLSGSIQFNLGDLDAPEIYLDSSLEFKFTPQMGEPVLVTVIGSRNATTIQRQMRGMSVELEPIESEMFDVLDYGNIGEFVQTGEDIFIGQTTVDWACDCTPQVCPTAVLISSQGEITEDTLKDIDSLLKDVDGRKAFEVSVPGLELTDSTQA